MGVIRTLYDRRDSIITEDKDREDEEKKVQTALQLCGYPKWTFKKIKTEMEQPKKKDNDKQRSWCIGKS